MSDLSVDRPLSLVRESQGEPPTRVEPGGEGRSRHRRLMALFHRACVLDDETRTELLREAEREDPELRRELERLLASDGEASGFFSHLDEERQSAVGERLEGLWLGPYRLLEKIGEGGASVVYRAARDDALYDREVAIKLLRHGLLSDELERRFRNERQILAALQHPHIAQLLDGGTTPDGSPYLVMELIEGTRIDTFCDQQNLSVRERLELFLDVCRAVQYAHRQLLVHRDLKPSNILVTRDGTTKLLDFGIAKLLAPERLAGDWELTRFDERLMTPEYASPEQVRGEPVTTATDVYALGVLLYKLLTGELPYAVERGAVTELVEAICSTEPKRPSLVATQRGEAERSRQLEGDLDVILLEALRKEPERRYPSVEAFAADVRRHLDGLPVSAREPTLRYRLGKFVGRNRTSVVLGTAAALLGKALVVGMAVQSRRVRRALERAEQEREQAEAAKREAELEAEKTQAVNRFLLDTLGQADPEEGKGPNLTVVEALIDAADHIDEYLGEQPEIAALVRETIGRTLANLGRYDEAECILWKALTSQRNLFIGDHKDVAKTLHRLGNVLRAKGVYQEAEAMYRRSLEMRRRLFGEEHLDVAESLNDLAGQVWEVGNVERAVQLHRQALAIRRSVLGDELHPLVAESHHNLGTAYWAQGDPSRAAQELSAALQIEATTHSTSSLNRAVTGESLALVCWELGDYESGRRLAEESLKCYGEVLPRPHPLVANCLMTLAFFELERGHFEVAERFIADSTAQREQLFEADHLDIAHSVHMLGLLRSSQGRFAEAEVSFSQAINLRKGRLGVGNWNTIASLEKLGAVQAALGKHSQARGSLETVVGRWSVSSPRRWQLGRARSLLGATLHALHRDEEAEPHLREGLARLKEVLGEKHRFTREAQERWDSFVADGGLSVAPRKARAAE